MRNELEIEMAKHAKRETESKSYSQRDINKVEELIKSVPIGKSSLKNSFIESNSMRKQLTNDENDLHLLRNNFKATFDFYQTPNKVAVIQNKNTHDDEDSSILTDRNLVHKPAQKPTIENYDDDKTLNSESKIETTTASKKGKENQGKNFGLNDYVKMFEDKPKQEETEDETPPKYTGKIKIEYSSSSVSSDEEKSPKQKSTSFNQAKNDKHEEDEDDDDFKW